MATTEEVQKWQQTGLYASMSREELKSLLQRVACDGRYAHVRNSEGLTPLLELYAHHFEDYDILYAALSTATKRFDINTVNKHGQTLLSLAVSRRQHSQVEELLEHGADPNISDEYDQTPLMLAAERGMDDSVETLLEFGANPLFRNHNGKTARELADESKEVLGSDEKYDWVKSPFFRIMAKLYQAEKKLMIHENDLRQQNPHISRKKIATSINQYLKQKQREAMSR